MPCWAAPLRTGRALRAVLGGCGGRFGQLGPDVVRHVGFLCGDLVGEFQGFEEFGGELADITGA